MRGNSSSVSRDKQTPPLSAITLFHRRYVDDTQRSSSHQCQSWSKVVIFVPVRGRRNIAIMLCTEKWGCGYPKVENFWRYGYSFWHNTRTCQPARWTDRRTPHDGRPWHRPCLCIIASCSKNCGGHWENSDGCVLTCLLTRLICMIYSYLISIMNVLVIHL